MSRRAAGDCSYPGGAVWFAQIGQQQSWGFVDERPDVRDTCRDRGPPRPWLSASTGIRIDWLDTVLIGTREARIRVLQTEERLGQITPQGQQELADLLNRPRPQRGLPKRTESQLAKTQPQARKRQKTEPIQKEIVSGLLLNARAVAVKSVPPIGQIAKSRVVSVIRNSGTH